MIFVSTHNGNGAQRPTLTLSGGKDSLLLLALCKPYRKRLHIVWSRTSETFPHMVDFMRETTRGWDFQELVSDQAAYFARHGFPSALIPVRHRPHEKNPGFSSRPTDIAARRFSTNLWRAISGIMAPIWCCMDRRPRI